MTGRPPSPYRWVRPGDLNAFFGLALDNMTQLVILSSLLIGVFKFPTDLVVFRMVPGTAVGVLVGDLVYTWLAFRLARKTGRDDVTAMPFGIDTASLSGIVFGVMRHRVALLAPRLPSETLGSLERARSSRLGSEGRGQVWRCPPGAEADPVEVGPGDTVVIPAAWRFQFRAATEAAQRFLFHLAPGREWTRPSR